MGEEMNELDENDFHGDFDMGEDCAEEE